MIQFQSQKQEQESLKSGVPTKLKSLAKSYKTLLKAKARIGNLRRWLSSSACQWCSSSCSCSEAQAKSHLLLAQQDAPPLIGHSTLHWSPLPFWWPCFQSVFSAKNMNTRRALTMISYQATLNARPEMLSSYRFTPWSAVSWQPLQAQVQEPYSILYSCNWAVIRKSPWRLDSSSPPSQVLQPLSAWWSTSN